MFILGKRVTKKLHQDEIKNDSAQVLFSCRLLSKELKMKVHVSIVSSYFTYV